jgi:hypothetical protein
MEFSPYGGGMGTVEKHMFKRLLCVAAVQASGWVDYSFPGQSFLGAKTIMQGKPSKDLAFLGCQWSPSRRNRRRTRAGSWLPQRRTRRWQALSGERLERSSSSATAVAGEASPPPRRSHGRPRELEVEDDHEDIVVILKTEILKMAWMAKTELILQHNDIYGISGFTITNPRLTKFTMTYKELARCYSVCFKW